MVRYYRELTRLEMEAVDKEETVVLIPIGALEQHGNQCPLGTDEIISEAVARRIRETLDREIPDYPMLIFPPVPVGLSTEHVNFCGSITLKPDTFYHVLEDICRELGQGAIAADPFWRGPDKNACRYCDYAAACHFEEGRGGDCRRWAHKLAAADFWTEVDGGKKHD